MKWPSAVLVAGICAYGVAVWDGEHKKHQAMLQNYVPTYFDLCGRWCEPTIEKSFGPEDRKVPNDRPIFEILFDCPQMPCTIRENIGGTTLAFALAGRAATLHPTARFVIDGLCASACATFADIARERVCATPLALLGFHQGYISQREGGELVWKETGKRFIPAHAADLHALVMEDGGYPAEGITFLSRQSVARIWKPCTPEPQTASPPYVFTTPKPAGWPIAH